MARRPQPPEDHNEPVVVTEHVLHKLAVTVDEAAHLLSLNRTKIFALVRCGELLSFKVGKSRRITVAALHDYLRRVQ